METNELKNIWNTLAENKLIDKEIAKENIKQIITKKGKGLIFKMKQKVMVDYVMYLSAFIIIPIAIAFVNIVLNRPSPLLQVIGVFVIECYLLLMFLKSKRKLNSLDKTDNTGTIKDSLINFRDNYLKVIHKEKWVIIPFGYFIISLALVQYFIYKGGIFPIDLSQSHSILPFFLILMLVLLPFVLKLEYKIRFSQIIKEINQTIDELNNETD